MLQVVFYLQWVWHSPNIRHLFTSCRKDRLCIWFVQSENKLDKKFNSSLPLVACSRDHVLLTLFVLPAYSGVQHTLCCVFCFVCLCLVYPKLTDSLDCPFLVALSVFSNVYLQCIYSGGYFDNHLHSKHNHGAEFEPFFYGWLQPEQKGGIIVVGSSGYDWEILPCYVQ